MDDTLIRLAYNNETTASYIFPSTYDAACTVLQAVFPQVSGGFTGLGSANASKLVSLARFTNLTALGGGSEIGY